MKRCLAGLCLLLMLLTACTARPSQTPVTAKDDAARRAWLEQQGWQTEEQPVRTLTVQLSLAGLYRTKIVFLPATEKSVIS